MAEKEYVDGYSPLTDYEQWRIQMVDTLARNDVAEAIRSILGL